MDDKKYQLRYLPLFYEDIAEVVDYISNDLQNPDAALKLIDLTEQAILKRLDNPLSFQPIRSKESGNIHITESMSITTLCFMSLLTTSWKSDASCTAEGIYNQLYNASKRFAGAALFLMCYYPFCRPRLSFGHFATIHSGYFCNTMIDVVSLLQRYDSGIARGMIRAAKELPVSFIVMNNPQDCIILT